MNSDTLGSTNCHVSGHRRRGRLFQDIVDRPPAIEGLVAPVRVESQGPKELAIVGDDALWEGKTQSGEIGDLVTMLELISLLRTVARLFRDRRDLMVENLV